MARCRCQKKMRLRSDGFKRCHRCGCEAPGLALRAERGAAILASEYPITAGKVAVPTTTFPRRLPVTWNSGAAQ